MGTVKTEGIIGCELRKEYQSTTVEEGRRFGDPSTTFDVHGLVYACDTEDEGTTTIVEEIRTRTVGGGPADTTTFITDNDVSRSSSFALEQREAAATRYAQDSASRLFAEIQLELSNYIDRNQIEVRSPSDGVIDLIFHPITGTTQTFLGRINFRDNTIDPRTPKEYGNMKSLASRYPISIPKGETGYPADKMRTLAETLNGNCTRIQVYAPTRENIKACKQATNGPGSDAGK